MVTPEPTRPQEVAITLGVDGRIYCHDLTPELLEVLAELCAADPELRVRQEIVAAVEHRDE